MQMDGKKEESSVPNVQLEILFVDNAQKFDKSLYLIHNSNIEKITGFV